jgi:hypothetical protein
VEESFYIYIHAGVGKIFKQVINIEQDTHQKGGKCTGEGFEDKVDNRTATK